MSSLRFRFKTYEFNGVDIHLKTLWDTQQYEDIDQVAENMGVPPSTWALFGVLWPAGEVLARHMITKDIEGLRILEVGCGIALPSLVLNSKNADISASDHHPSSKTFLEENVKLNSGPEIPFYIYDWRNYDESIGKFDLIIGSDILYQPDNTDLLVNFMKNHAKEKAEVILVDPGRGHSSDFRKKMALLNFTHEITRAQDFKGQIITLKR